MNKSIRIRRYATEDTKALFDAVAESREELSPWMPWCHEQYSLQDAKEWVESRPGAWNRNEEWSFLIVDSHDQILGGCGIHRLAARDGTAELGYWVRTAQTNHGVATAATIELCDWAFQEKKIHRLEIIVSVENLPSQRVAEKVGGVREGVLRERVLLNGRLHDCLLYAVLNQHHQR